MHRTKATTSIGGRIDDMLCDRSVFFSSKLKTCVRGLLDMRVFRIGNLFLRQAKGIPIGGPISGAILDLVLASAECIFDTFSWPFIAKTCKLTGPGHGGLPSGGMSMTSSAYPVGFVPVVSKTSFRLSIKL